MLAQNRDGHRLLRALLPHSLTSEQSAVTTIKVLARHDDKVLLVFERQAQRWQLPGGSPNPGEPPVTCGARRLHEQSSNSCSEADLSLVYAFETEVEQGPSEARTRTELGLLFATDIGHIAAFLPTEEIGATLWWGGSDLSHELDAIDEKLLELARGEPQSVALSSQ